MDQRPPVTDPDEKRRIVAIMNFRTNCNVPVSAIEIAIANGFTTWESLRQEIEEPFYGDDD